MLEIPMPPDPTVQAEPTVEETERDPRWFDPIAKAVRPVVRHMARAYARAGAGDEDDLIQDGLVALADAFRRFDGTRANARTYARGVLTRKYNNALRDARRMKRVPMVWKVDERGRRQVPCPLVSLDQLMMDARESLNAASRARRFDGFSEPIEQRAGPETEAVEEIDQSDAIRTVLECLDPFQAKVFRLWLCPSAGLLATARNLTGCYTVQVRHIAIYLGSTTSRVEGALREVRTLVAALDAGAVEES
jgi:RNA polymerase sigma factor (sigma-70 family)